VLAKAFREPLWSRYCHLRRDEKQGYETRKDHKRDNLWERIGCWKALEACVTLDPDWLEAKIRSANHASDPVDALTAFLRELPDGRERWLSLKEILRTKVSGSGEREFAINAHHWCDTDEAGWLRERVPVTEELVGAYCLRALIRTAPEVAISALPPPHM
jgi:hypothetical protein